MHALLLFYLISDYKCTYIQKNAYFFQSVKAKEISKSQLSFYKK